MLTLDTTGNKCYNPLNRRLVSNMENFDIKSNIPDINIANILSVNEVKKNTHWVFDTLKHPEIKGFPLNIYRFMYLTSGSYVTKFDKSEFTQQKGALILLNPTKYDYINVSTDVPTSYYCISFITSEPIDEKYFTFARSIVYPKNKLKLEELFLSAYNIFLEKPITWQIDIKAITCQIFSMFCKQHHYNDIKKHIPRDMINTVNEIEARVFDDKFKISELAKKINVSVEHFTRTFTNTFGISPKKYIINLKLKRAALLLEKSDKSIHEICNEVKFCDISYFNKMFKKNYNITPSQYRKKFSSDEYY